MIFGTVGRSGLTRAGAKAVLCRLLAATSRVSWYTTCIIPFPNDETRPTKVGPPCSRLVSEASLHFGSLDQPVFFSLRALDDPYFDLSESYKPQGGTPYFAFSWFSSAAQN